MHEQPVQFMSCEIPISLQFLPFCTSFFRTFSSVCYLRVCLGPAVCCPDEASLIWRWKTSEGTRRRGKTREDEGRHARMSEQTRREAKIGEDTLRRAKTHEYEQAIASTRKDMRRDTTCFASLDSVSTGQSSSPRTLLPVPTMISPCSLPARGPRRLPKQSPAKRLQLIPRIRQNLRTSQLICRLHPHCALMRLPRRCAQASSHTLFLKVVIRPDFSTSTRTSRVQRPSGQCIVGPRVDQATPPPPAKVEHFGPSRQSSRFFWLRF